MAVRFSNQHIQVQFIDDVAGVTLAATSTLSKDAPDRDKLAANAASAKIIGALAAKRAGMHVVATTNAYTAQEDLSMADLIVNCLGDAAGPHATLQSDHPDFPLKDGCVHARDLVEWFRAHA